LLSDYVEIKRFRANPTHVVGDLDCYSMPPSGKFGVFDEHTRRSRPCMSEYSSREVYSQPSVSDTKGVDLNSCVGRGLKPYSDIDWRSYRSRYVRLVNAYRWRTGSRWRRSSLSMRRSILALSLLSCDQWPRTRSANSKTCGCNPPSDQISSVHRELSFPSAQHEFISAQTGP
jgi:hypothetical protein